ncbi:hypothetical protein [Spiroplasma phoeniceum]|uniref:hypothetical protein n=1 Tax=Spiroplasma phoeniceum TaxID=47835 RepID=UPI001C9A70AD|nr:hypothetical protein [Spiroplasma phoeniceum]
MIKVLCLWFYWWKKDNAIAAVKKAISDFKNIFGIRIIRNRTDNGSEFINNYRNNQKILLKKLILLNF